MIQTWNNDRPFLEANAVLSDGDMICAFDTETTGVGCDDKIIQFSAIRWRVHKSSSQMRLEEEAYMDRLINPLEPLSEKIVEITGITDAQLANCKTEDAFAGDILRFISRGVSAWLGHNIAFDIRMIRGMADRTGYRFFDGVQVLDTLALSRAMYPGKAVLENHKLGTVAEYLLPASVMEQRTLHCALDDIRLTSNIFEVMMNRYLESRQEHEVVSEKGKEAAVLEYAYYFQNPHQQRQKRICLALTTVDRPSGSKGEIYWDLIEHCWAHKTQTAAKRLFQSLDIADLERRVIQKYAWMVQQEMGVRKNDITMETVAQTLMKRWQRRQKECAS